MSARARAGRIAVLAGALFALAAPAPPRALAPSPANDAPGSRAFDAAGPPGADPDLERAQGRDWLYATAPGSGDRIALYVRRDRGGWVALPPPLRRDAIGWIAADGAPRHYLWAPDMVRRHDGWRLFFAVGPQGPTPSRIGVARCTGPAGPCRDSGRPLVTGDAGFEAIDPALFVDPADGTAYLFAGGSAGARLRAWVMRPDLMAIDHEVSVATPPGFTEAPFMHWRRGVYYLSWSSGHWDRADYHVAYATAPRPTGPWRLRGVLLAGDARFRGPGHHSIVRDERGRWRIAYHRWVGRRGDGPWRGERQLTVQPLGYRPDGTIRRVVPR